MINIREKVQVCIPFPMLKETYLDRFLSERINPEIGLDAVCLDRFSLREYSEIAEKLRERELRVTIHAPFQDLSAGSTDPAIREVTRKRFEQVLRVLPIFSPRSVVCHAGYDRKRYKFVLESWFFNSVETWSWLSARVRDEGAVLMLENVYEHDPEDLVALFEALSRHKVGFCFDIGHQNAFSRAGFEKWMSVLGAYVGQLHLHDNSGGWDDHRPMGSAGIDFPSFFAKLKKYRKTTPIVTLEPHREEDLEPSLEYLEKNWPWG